MANAKLVVDNPDESAEWAMLTLHALRIELGKSYRVTLDLLSEMPGVLAESRLTRLPHYTTFPDWFETIPRRRGGVNAICYSKYLLHMFDRKVSRAVEIYRTEGPVNLLQKTGRYLIRHPLDVLRNNYLRYKGQFSVEVRGVRPTFDSTTVEAADRVEWTIDRERQQIEDVVSELEGNDVFFDIGANIGVYTNFASERINSGSVIAFEPYQPNVDSLKRNIQFASCNVELFSLALSNFNGQTGFSAPDEPEAGFQCAGISPDSKTDSILTRTGDSLVNEGDCPHPTVVKIDVEGAEPLVIDGLENALSSEECRALFCELHLPKEPPTRPSLEDFGENLESMIETIEDLGFSIESRQRRSKEVYVMAKK